jgi:hypothetical protein
MAQKIKVTKTTKRKYTRKKSQSRCKTCGRFK